ncbi:hypothetical protein SAMN05216315_10814 [Nitrosospira sp. Nsp18]|uniref:hypothetical protein n=1 Tax=Nitrosospira sp. Nsp18 TaxID=1855334 RepID=UPI000890D22E|nr:hypothetical protein [Nitrosospira sp. Nsp18]SDA16539.1 hypothetical protein SAMN05216315_10814 [Nitrosospira sp. Nsp18]
MIKDEHTKDFLIAEYESSWQQVLNIDTRRGTFSNYYNLGFLGVLAFIVNFWSRPNPITWTTMVLITAVLVFSYLIANAVIRILESERKANVRYRKKINLIRENFLSDMTDPNILHYMQRKELGIKDFSNDEKTIDAVGGTLKYIYKMINLQKWALVLIGVLLWASFLSPFVVGCVDCIQKGA